MDGRGAGERLKAARELGESVPGEQLTKEQVRTLISTLHDIVALLKTADPKLKAEVYAELGVRVHYDATRRVIKVETRPTNACAGFVSGDTEKARESSTSEATRLVKGRKSAWNGRVGEGITPISTPTGWRTEWDA